MDRFEGLDPAEVAAIEARLEAAAAQEDIQTIAAITAQVCQTLIGLADAVKALGEVVWPATEAITDLARRLEAVEESPLQKMERNAEFARQTRLALHAAAIARGEAHAEFESGERPWVVTEFGREPASPGDLERLGIHWVEETT